MAGSGELASRSTRLATPLVAVIPVFVLVALMWISEIVDQLPSLNLDQYGIRPRNDEGLMGIATAPFLHGGFAHLLANTGAFIVLGCLIALTTQRFMAATIGIAIIGGLGTWLVAEPNTVHIGASGLVYGYVTFLVAWGVLRHKVIDILVAVVVVAMYGGIVVGVLPGNPGISWQGHLFGAVGGVVMAWFLTRNGADDARRFSKR